MSSFSVKQYTKDLADVTIKKNTKINFLGCMTIFCHIKIINTIINIKNIQTTCAGAPHRHQ